jgi:hypothetical protein
VVLRNEKTGQEIKVGDIVETFRGDKVVVKTIVEPNATSESGYVYVTYSDVKEFEFTRSYYPSVISAKFYEN